jgi:hypothetical protein
MTSEIDGNYRVSGANSILRNSAREQISESGLEDERRNTLTGVKVRLVTGH